jgi:hypothetical protein
MIPPDGHYLKLLKTKQAVLWQTICSRTWAILSLTILAGGNPAQAGPGAFATKINFSGHVWAVKTRQTPVGPGPNYFSDRRENVWVDSEGKLHLKVGQTDGQWRCAEIVSEESFGLGTYRFQVSTPLEKFDPNLILGLYTWSDTSDYANREIDIECSRWGQVDDTNNAQFVVQPYPPVDRRLRFHVPAQLENTTYSFCWQTNRVQFSCLQDRAGVPAGHDAVVQEWNFPSGAIPPPGDENVRMNLWLLKGRPPLDAKDVEIIISKFEFSAATNRLGADRRP